MFILKHMYTGLRFPERKNNGYSRLQLGETSVEIMNGEQQTIIVEHPPGFEIIMWSITKLGIILAYFYVADRTNHLLKENK